MDLGSFLMLLFFTAGGQNVCFIGGNGAHLIRNGLLWSVMGRLLHSDAAGKKEAVEGLYKFLI